MNKVSKLEQKALEAIKALEAKQAKEGLTPYELARLANAKRKLELRSISGVYKHLKVDPLSKDVLGKSAFPTFKAFSEKAGDRQKFSFWAGLLILAKFNKVQATKKRVTRQNKAQAKAAA